MGRKKASQTHETMVSADSVQRLRLQGLTSGHACLVPVKITLLISSLISYCICIHMSIYIYAHTHKYIIT